MPSYTSVRDGKVTEVPNEIALENGQKLIFAKEKTAGTSVGGWYQDGSGKKYMVKFGGEPHAEKMFNDLLGIAVGEEYKAETAVGYGVLEGEKQPCFIVGEIAGYADVATIPDIEVRKEHAPKFHMFYVFQGLLANDDLNEENFGLVNGERPMMIDFGDMPRFLHPEQVEQAGIPHSLASLIGHRDDSSWRQKTRRRYFGAEEFSVPEPFKLQEFTSEDISYGAILSGVRQLSENKSLIIGAIHDALEKVQSNPNLSDEYKQSYLTKYQNFARIISERISWMENNFAEDLRLIENPEMLEKFNGIKWRLTDQFAHLMKEEERVFKECAQEGLNKGLRKISDAIVSFLVLDKQSDLPKFNRKEILDLNLDEATKGIIKQVVSENFTLHDAIIAGDYDVAKWLVNNDLADPNSNRRARNHNYQFFRLTPVHVAIAIYNDKLHYGAKLSELNPLREMIHLLEAKFIEKNGVTKPEGVKEDLSITLAREALNSFEEKTQVSAKAVAGAKIRKFIKKIVIQKS